MPYCPEDRYPMIPVRETVAGALAWGCSNPWHPRNPGPCPRCYHGGLPRTAQVSGKAEARCPKCRHQWQPPI